MHWFQSLDITLFRFCNDALINPVFDAVMPFASGNKLFVPAVVIGAILLVWKGGRRGRVCGLMLALIIGPGDGLIINRLKHAFARPRPFVVLENVRVNGQRRSAPELTTMETAVAPGRPRSHNSLPSAHAANWGAAVVIFLVYYRLSWRITLPLAGVVAFSRLYNGVHYPSDVLAGLILGASYAAAEIWTFNFLWQWTGPKWFPRWWRQLPSLVNPDAVAPAANLPRNVA